MTTVNVVYGGGPDHEPCLITLDGVPYDPADLARLGREVIALEYALAEERQKVADLERDLAAARREVEALRCLEPLNTALRLEAEERAETALAALRARLSALEAPAESEWEEECHESA